jgi:hypothetical protein
VVGSAPASLLALGISGPVIDGAGTRYFEPDGVDFYNPALASDETIFQSLRSYPEIITR